MKFSDFFLISLGSLKRRRLRSWLTMIGIFIGIVAVVTLISLGQGLEAVVIGQFSIAGTDLIQIQASGTGNGPPGAGVIKHLTTKNLEAIEKVPGIKYAIGRLVEPGMVEFNNKANLRYVASISKDAKENELANLEAEQGRLLKGDDIGRVMVGSEFSDPEAFGKPVAVGSRITVNNRQFQVVGILKKKGSFVTDTTVDMTYTDMKELFDTGDNLDIIGVKVQEGVDISDVKARIEKVLRKERDVKLGEEDFSVQTNENALKNLKSTLFAVQLFVYIIAFISIVVGGIGIMNTMYTSVLERTREIGIMKAIGAKNSTIFGLFFIESGLLGTVGGLVGITVGVLLAKGMEFVGRIALKSSLLRADIQIWVLVGALIFSFVVGTVSGILPAMQASKMNPVDALKE